MYRHKLSAHVARARTRTQRERETTQDKTRRDEEVPVLCAADCDKNTAITRDNAVSGGGSSDRVEGSGDLGEGRGEGAATLSQGWQTISACGTRGVAWRACTRSD